MSLLLFLRKVFHDWTCFSYGGFLIVGTYLVIVFGAGGLIMPIESNISWIFSADNHNGALVG